MKGQNGPFTPLASKFLALSPKLNPGRVFDPYAESWDSPTILYIYLYRYTAIVRFMTAASKLPTSPARHTAVMPVAEARKELSTLLKGFSDQTQSEPVYIGAHRKAEAVLVPLSIWEQVLDFIDDLEIAKIVKERGDGPFEEIPADQFAEVMRKYIKDNR